MIKGVEILAFIKKLFKFKKKKPVISDKARLKTSRDILKDIDNELADRVKDNVCLAYADASYGFGVDELGHLYVLICTTSCRTNKLITLDEFTVDVDFTAYSRKELLNYLSKQINDELERIHLESLYV